MRSGFRHLLPILAACAAVAGASGAAADELREGGKLLLTHGVSTIEGSAGGGLATWAVIAGDETRNGIGAQANFSYVGLPDYQLRDFGGAIGFYDRLEVSYAHQEFDTGATGAKLGLGDGFTFDQDVFGAKLKLVGDAVYGQDTWFPQVAVGVQYKHNDQGAIIHAVGGKHADGADYYVTATKVFLDQSLVVSGAVRLTKANQTGLLGFGGDLGDSYKPQFEGSVGYLLTRRLVIGGEYRTKPSNLGFAKENNWFDLFAAYALTRNLSVTAGYVDAGSIATFGGQHGLYLSMQAGF